MTTFLMKTANILTRTNTSVLKSITQINQVTIYRIEIVIEWAKFKRGLLALSLWIYPIYVLINSII